MTILRLCHIRTTPRVAGEAQAGKLRHAEIRFGLCAPSCRRVARAMGAKPPSFSRRDCPGFAQVRFDQIPPCRNFQTGQGRPGPVGSNFAHPVLSLSVPADPRPLVCRGPMTTRARGERVSDPITSSTSDRNPNRRFAQYESRDRIHFVILRYLRSPSTYDI